jgi:hypothetical protein
MDNVDRKVAELAVLSQQTNRIVSKASPAIVLAGVLQESVNLNQQWSQAVAELIQLLNDERKAKSPDGDGGQVSGEARSPAT